MEKFPFKIDFHIIDTNCHAFLPKTKEIVFEAIEDRRTKSDDFCALSERDD